MINSGLGMSVCFPDTMPPQATSLGYGLAISQNDQNFDQRSQVHDDDENKMAGYKIKIDLKRNKSQLLRSVILKTRLLKQKT